MIAERLARSLAATEERKRIHHEGHEERQRRKGSEKKKVHPEKRTSAGILCATRFGYADSSARSVMRGFLQRMPRTILLQRGKGLPMELASLAREIRALRTTRTRICVAESGGTTPAFVQPFASPGGTEKNNPRSMENLEGRISGETPRGKNVYRGCATLCGLPAGIGHRLGLPARRTCHLKSWLRPGYHRSTAAGVQIPHTDRGPGL